MSTRPFAPFEWMIAWRYLRARRAEGGVSVMTWISLLGITLAVAALIITLAVRSGFRTEFVDTILGANAHVTVYSAAYDASGAPLRTIADYPTLAGNLSAVSGVTRAAPLVKGQVMANLGDRNSGAEVLGIAAADLAAIPRVANPLTAQGSLADFDAAPRDETAAGPPGIAIGMDLAQELGASVGDRIRLISPSGVRTALGTSPRVAAFQVVYVFRTGRYQIDRSRIYMPFAAAQSFFNREGVADEIEVMLADPEHVDQMTPALLAAAGPGMMLWSWKDAAGDYLDALAIEDTVMFVLMAILVLIASLNIISGLVMLVKNKGRDIGILRTMGLTRGSILRIFFLCGALVGLIGTALGVALGCLFALYFDPILAFLNGASGGGVWQPSVRGIYRLPARLQAWDVARAVGLSLVLSFGVTLFPARRAARMNPVEALRYE